MTNTQFVNLYHEFAADEKTLVKYVRLTKAVRNEWIEKGAESEFLHEIENTNNIYGFNIDDYYFAGFASIAEVAEDIRTMLNEKVAEEFEKYCEMTEEERAEYLAERKKAAEIESKEEEAGIKIEEAKEEEKEKGAKSYIEQMEKSGNKIEPEKLEALKSDVDVYISAIKDDMNGLPNAELGEFEKNHIELLYDYLFPTLKPDFENLGRIIKELKFAIRLYEEACNIKGVANYNDSLYNVNVIEEGEEMNELTGEQLEDMEEALYQIDCVNTWGTFVEYEGRLMRADNCLERIGSELGVIRDDKADFSIFWSDVERKFEKVFKPYGKRRSIRAQIEKQFLYLSSFDYEDDGIYFYLHCKPNGEIIRKVRDFNPDNVVVMMKIDLTNDQISEFRELEECLQTQEYLELLTKMVNKYQEVFPNA